MEKLLAKMIMATGILKKVRDVKLDRFETRKIVFSSEIINEPTLKDGLVNAVHLELLWLKNKKSYYSIIEKDIIHNFDSNDLKKKFDIIFLDPPYKVIELKEIISPIISQKILKQNGIMIIHRHKNQNDILPKPVKILEEKKYGISKILFCTYN